MQITCYGKTRISDLGWLPNFLNEAAPGGAVEQLNRGYVHGGGWHSIPGFTMVGSILYFPGDPPQRPIAQITFREEVVLIYPYSIVAVVEADRSFQVARMD